MGYIKVVHIIMFNTYAFLFKPFLIQLDVSMDNLNPSPHLHYSQHEKSMKEAYEIQREYKV